MASSGLKQQLREVKLLLPVGAVGFLASVLQIVQLVIAKQYSVILVSLVVMCFIVVVTGVAARIKRARARQSAGQTQPDQTAPGVSRMDKLAYFALGLTVASILALIGSVAVGRQTRSPSSPVSPGSVSSHREIKLFDLPSNNAHPVEIESGPDGNMWFTEQDTDKIGRITPDGDIREFPVPTINAYPFAIASGPDGNMWFTEGKPDDKSGNRIGRITPTGEVREFPLPTDGANPVSIIAGPDGNLWFTEYNIDKIGRISTVGSITEFPVSTHNGRPDQITVGPDGALWFTEFFSNMIGRITTDGAVSEFPIPTPDAHPVDIVAGQTETSGLRSLMAIASDGSRCADRLLRRTTFLLRKPTRRILRLVRTARYGSLSCRAIRSRVSLQTAEFVSFLSIATMGNHLT
jgi:streptogramin lyase